VIEFSFEKQAIKGEPLPAGLSGAEQVLYHGLRLLYAQYRMGIISRTQAKAEKFQLVQLYEKIDFDCKAWEASVGVWKRLEGAVARYRASKTTENADKCLEAIYGVPMR
jgi:hypothetical protein